MVGASCATVMPLNMRLACHGFVSDGSGSGAGSFPLLLADLLERGHSVSFFGIPRFTEPRSLDRFENYRFVPLSVPAIDRWGRRLRKAEARYPAAVHSTLSHIAYQREAIVQMERSVLRPDLVLCVDAQNLWPSSLPVMSWPQAPPQAEWQALREPSVAAGVVSNGGRRFLAASHAFRAYRWLQSRMALPSSEVVICGSDWAKAQWIRFGCDAERAVTLAYPVDTSPFIALPTLESHSTTTFLWLGRAVPRKRLDLFLAAFDLLRASDRQIRARLVGDFESDAGARTLIERYRSHDAILVEGRVPRAQVPAVFQNSDVLVQPSQHENFGFSVAEALAAGKPVVLGPSNGTAAYGGDAAYVFDTYEPASVARAMARAANDVRSDPAGVAARARHAARHFERAQVADRFVELAEAVIERKRSSLAAGPTRAAAG